MADITDDKKASLTTRIVGGDEEYASEVDSDKNLHTEVHGNDIQGDDKVASISSVSTLNSTSTLLLAGETFTGQFQDCSGFSAIAVTILVDQASDIGGAVLEFSTDGTPAKIITRTVFTSSPIPGGAFASFPCEARFFRLTYTNGPVNQGFFNLQTVLKTEPVGHVILPLIGPISDITPVPIVRAVASGRNPNGIYSNETQGGVLDASSTTTPLLAGQEFIGPWIDFIEYGGMIVSSKSDQEGEVFLETSSDGITLSDSFSRGITLANEPYFIGVTPKRRFMRIRYVNGATNQTSFDLQVILSSGLIEQDTGPIDSSISNDTIAIVTRSIIAGQREDGNFGNVDLSNSSSIKVAIADRPSEVRGRIHVDKNIEAVAISGTPTVIHTVTAGHTFYLTSLIVSSLNEGNTIGRMVIRDSVVNKIPFVLSSQASGAAAPANVSSPPLPEPMPFTSDVSIIELAGNITASITIVGYEELNP